MPEVIEKVLAPIEATFVERFSRATQATEMPGLPPTLVTAYRHGEFEWFERLGITLKNVLHLEQEYEYLSDLNLGDSPRVRTWVAESKKRGGMEFMTLVSEISVGDRVCVRSRTVFIVREIAGAKA